MIGPSPTHHEFKAFVACAGIGLLGKGLQRGHARMGTATASFRLIGAIDVDPLACADHLRLTGVRCAEIDLFSREQYIDFHGHQPPSTWREATADDIRNAAGGEDPDVVGWSPPCKGLSSLLNALLSESRKYQALNGLVLRALQLMLDAWAHNPPALFLLENVPRIQTRGRDLLNSVKLLLEMAGYVCAETVHDCGELGGLAQHRQRFLLVARHRMKIRPFLYEPDRRPVRGVGEVVGRLPYPGDPAGGPMHSLPRLQWRTWVRLALIEAGSDWRSLNRLEVSGGVVQGLRVAAGFEWHNGVLGVRGWDQPAVTVTGESLPFNGAFAVADPRSDRKLGDYQPYGVTPWDEPAGTVTGQSAPGGGVHSVADPRPGTGWDGKGKYQTTAWEDPSPAVIAGSTTGQGAFTVADPRLPTKFNDCFRVIRWDEAAQAITSGAGPGSGAQSIADPRVGSKREGGDFESARHYGVLRWDESSPAITGSACHDNGAHSVADPRDPKERCAPWIWSLDGTRHRPFTTLEMLALQGYDLADILDVRLAGTDSQQREHIGNGVPVAAAESMGSTFLGTLLAAKLGQGFILSQAPIWVDRRLALSLVANPVEAA